MGKIMLSKYGHLMLPSGTLPNNVTPGIDFTDEAVVQCSPVGANNLQMITNKF